MTITDTLITSKLDEKAGTLDYVFAIEQVVRLAPDDHALDFPASLRNTGTITMTSVDYMRVITSDIDLSQHLFATIDKMVDLRAATEGPSGLTPRLAPTDPRASANITAMPSIAVRFRRSLKVR